jgi:UDP-N-acetyl-D-mannosaminuronic acid dehydrogenase
MKSQRICILGLGYIGLPTAGMFAINGIPVLGVDINKDILSRVEKGGVHIAEPGLRTVIAAAVGSGRLTVSPEVQPSDVIIIAVPTPITHDKKADLSHLVSASRMIVPHLQKGNMVVVESTIPPGTTEEVVLPILQESGLKAAEDFDLVHSPERVIPGKVLLELTENDRVIGGITPAAAERAKLLYQSFVRGKIYTTDIKTAEMVKLIENSFRDINIAFANELSIICSRLGINVWEAIEMANRHPRVNILEPGPGVGGHCIAVDPWFIVEKFPQESRLIGTARRVNDHMPEFIIDRIKSLLPTGQKVAVWGLTYKPDVDDMRESPSLDIVRLLQKEGYKTGVYDPYIKQGTETEVHSLQDSVDQASMIAVLVAHSDLKFINPKVVAPMMKQKMIIDVKNHLNRKEWEECGFVFLSL